MLYPYQQKKEQFQPKSFDLQAAFVIILLVVLSLTACAADDSVEQSAEVVPAKTQSRAEPSLAPTKAEPEQAIEAEATVDKPQIQPPPAGITRSSIGEQTTPPLISFTGTWSSPDYGPIVLIQEGDTVVGAYSLRDQYGFLAGNVEGETLSHQWWQGPTPEVTYEEAESRGDAYFTIVDDGKTIAGRWRPEGAAEWAGEWNLTKISDQADISKLAPPAEATAPAGDSILMQGATHLPLASSIDLDGQGADFWSDAGGIAARSPEFEPGSGDYASLTFSQCRNKSYQPSIPWGPFPGDAYCFMTNQGYIGKFLIANVDENGGIAIEYTVWNYASPTVPHPPASR
jgi:hypothetical protein